MPLDIKKSFGMNHARCEDGAWFPMGDARLLIASLYSRRHQLARATLESAIRRNEQGTLSDVDIRDMECELYGNTVLLGWENVTEDGAPLEPTLEHRIRLLREAPPFLVAVKNLAREFTPYQVAADEGVEKNSVRSSPGKAGGDRRTNDGSAGSQKAA